MDTILHKYTDKIKGIIEGFDRIVFKGILMPIVYAAGMQCFLKSRNILNKDFKNYAIAQSQAIIQSAETLSKSHCGSDITYILSHKERKETLAHNRQKEIGVRGGLIGVWSCVTTRYTDS